MKKILVDASPFNDGYQGTTTYLRNIYHKHGESCDVIFLVAINSEQGKNLDMILPQAKRVFYLSKGWFFDLFLLGGIINSIRPDFVHFQYKLPFNLRAKKILTIHDVLYLDFPQFFPLKYRLIRKWATWIMIRKADIVLTVSEYSSERIKYHTSYKGKINVIPNVVDFTSVKKAKPVLHMNLSDYDRVILSINRIEDRKGQLSLIDALSNGDVGEIDGKRSLLILVGADTWSLMFNKGYESGKVYRTHNLLDWVWLNKITEEEKSFLFRESDVYLNTSGYEGFGLGIIEAALWQKFIISPKTTALGELAHLIDEEYDVSDPTTSLINGLRASECSTMNTVRKDLKDYELNVVNDRFYSEIIEAN